MFVPKTLVEIKVLAVHDALAPPAHPVPIWPDVTVAALASQRVTALALQLAPVLVAGVQAGVLAAQNPNTQCTSPSIDQPIATATMMVESM